MITVHFEWPVDYDGSSDAMRTEHAITNVETVPRIGEHVWVGDQWMVVQDVRWYPGIASTPGGRAESVARIVTVQLR